MTSKTDWLLCIGVSVGVIFAGTANAKPSREEVAKAEAKMSAACKKEYPKILKGKNFKDLAEWVEAEERGPNKEQFLKSKCYSVHEDWEELVEHDPIIEEQKHH